MASCVIFMKIYHKNLTDSEIHVIHAWSFVDELERITASNISSTDVGKVAFQEDNSSFWLLKDAAGPVWDAITNSTISGSVLDDINIGAYSETVIAPLCVAGILTLDMRVGNVFEIELVENVSILIANPPTPGNSGSITLILKQDSYGNRVVTSWPAAVKWSQNNIPTLTALAGAVDILVFVTTDGGVVWYGMLAGSNFL